MTSADSIFLVMAGNTTVKPRLIPEFGPSLLFKILLRFLLISLLELSNASFSASVSEGVQILDTYIYFYLLRNEQFYLRKFINMLRSSTLVYLRFEAISVILKYK